MVRTLTAPPTDRSMWRRLLRSVHPDAGGTHELFVWVRELQEHVTGDMIEPPRSEQRSYPLRRTTSEDSPRVPFEDAFEVAQSFDDLTRRALALADRDTPEPHASLLLLLLDCSAV